MLIFIVLKYRKKINFSTINQQNIKNTLFFSQLFDFLKFYLSQKRPFLRQIKQEKNMNLKHKNEDGRSMVEMLGTLAIIGVLSVGGIAGYNYAMDKHKANETINDVNLRMIDIMTHVAQGREVLEISSEFDTIGRAGYTIDLFQNTDGEPSIMVENVPSSVCKMILKSTSDTQDIYVGTLNGEQVNGNWYLGDNEDICDGGNKEILFALDEGILSGLGNTNTDSESTVTTLECYSNADCRPDAPYCENGTCIQCLTDNNCNSRNHYCDVGTCKKCPDDNPFWNGKKCVECITDDDCVRENTLCFEDNSDCYHSNYNTCKTYTIHASTIIDGKEWVHVYVDNPAKSHEHYWPSWWDGKKVCAHLNKKLPSVPELVNNWNGLNGWNTCLNQDCGYTYNDTAKTLFNNFNLSGYSLWFREEIDGCSVVTGSVNNQSSAYLGSFGRHYDNNGVRVFCHD